MVIIFIRKADLVMTIAFLRRHYDVNPIFGYFPGYLKFYSYRSLWQKQFLQLNSE